MAHLLLGDGSVESNGYQYDISIQTGMWNDFGTTAKVGMIISGKEGSSNVLSLNDMPISRKFFSRASVNNFTIFVKKSLGDLTGVYVWHDNSGRRPSWYLQQILITDVQTKKEWYFFANQWLALDKGAGVTQLHLKVRYFISSAKISILLLLLLKHKYFESLLYIILCAKCRNKFNVKCCDLISANSRVE